MDIDNKQLERDIENAIRARGLKAQMKQWEADLHRIPKPSEGVEGAALPAAATPTTQKPKSKSSAWPKLRRTIYTLSAVAVLVGIVIMAVPTSVWRSSYRQASSWAYRQYAHYFMPSQPKNVVYENSTETLVAMANPSVNQIVADRYELEILGHEDLIQDAAWQIQKANYAVAEQILADARDALSTDDAHYQETMDDIEYLEALCHLGQNRRTKAKKLLTAIADSNSRHREAAAQLAAEIK
jgi:hypothetical protein